MYSDSNSNTVQLLKYLRYCPPSRCLYVFLSSPSPPLPSSTLPQITKTREEIDRAWFHDTRPADENSESNSIRYVSGIGRQRVTSASLITRRYTELVVSDEPPLGPFPILLSEHPYSLGSCAARFLCLQGSSGVARRRRESAGRILLTWTFGAKRILDARNRTY